MVSPELFRFVCPNCGEMRATVKRWGGRKVGTRISLTMEKEALIQQLHAQGQAIAAIARLVGLSRKSVYKALETARKVA